MGQWGVYESRGGGDHGEGRLHGPGENHRQHAGFVYLGTGEGTNQRGADADDSQTADPAGFPGGREAVAWRAGFSPTLRRGGALGRAEALAQQALQIREAVLAPVHPGVGQSLGQLAALRALHDPAKTHRLCDRTRLVVISGCNTAAAGLSGEGWQDAQARDMPAPTSGDLAAAPQRMQHTVCRASGAGLSIVPSGRRG
jgi:hypothetical protein